MQISQLAINHIIEEEVSSPAYYEKHYRRPEWPGGASGVTVGNGYDLGYASPAKIREDFGGRVSATMLEVMVRCSGVKGAAAKSLLSQVKSKIDIPWPVAYAVFIERDVPQWTATVLKAVGPNFELMTPTCAGVEVGLAYNRGAGGFNLAGDRYLEMRQIKACIVRKDFAAIPVLHEKMARIWEGTSIAGVAKRRRREAALFRKGLLEKPGEFRTVEVPKVEVQKEVAESSRQDQRARTPQPKTTNTQNSTAAVVVAGPPAVAKAAGASNGVVGLVAFVAIAVAVAVFVIWYKKRNPHGGFAPVS